MPVTCSLLNPVFRETEADWFASGTYVVAGTSIFARPDAVSLDYQTAYAYGPMETGSAETGLVAKAWRVRQVNNNNNTSDVFLTRENDDGTGWRLEHALFSYADAPIIEIDLAFAGDGRAVVAASRYTNPTSSFESGSELWVYWYSPLSASFQFDNFGIGKTPRLLCDMPDISALSDVLVFYIKDSGGNVYYRQQRDQYNIEYHIPLPIPSSVSGSNYGSLDGGLVGTLSGSFSGSLFGYVFGAPISGLLVGTSSVSSSGLLIGEVIPSSSTFNGSLVGVWTGSLNGILVGTLDGNPFSGSTVFISGIMSGSLLGNLVAGEGEGDCVRSRTWPASGSFSGSLTGWSTGSYTGSFTSGMAIGTLSGLMSGSMSGSMAGIITGDTSGSQLGYFDTYLEDVVKLRDSRVALYYSRRNALTAQYSIHRFETLLYPIPVDPDKIEIGALFMTGSLVDVVLVPAGIAGYHANYLLGIQTASLVLMLNNTSVPFGNNMHASYSLGIMSQSLTTGSLNFSFPYYNNLHTSYSLSIMSASLTKLVLEYSSSLGRDDAFVSCSVFLISGTLA